MPRSRKKLLGEEGVDRGHCITNPNNALSHGKRD